MTHPYLVLKDRVEDMRLELAEAVTCGARHAFERHVTSLEAAVAAYTRKEPTPADWYAMQEERLAELRERLAEHNAELRRRRL